MQFVRSALSDAHNFPKRYKASSASNGIIFSDMISLSNRKKTPPYTKNILMLRGKDYEKTLRLFLNKNVLNTNDNIVLILDSMFIYSKEGIDGIRNNLTERGYAVDYLAPADADSNCGFNPFSIFKSEEDIEDYIDLILSDKGDEWLKAGRKTLMQTVCLVMLRYLKEGDRTIDAVHLLLGNDKSGSPVLDQFVERLKNSNNSKLANRIIEQYLALEKKETFIVNSVANFMYNPDYMSVFRKNTVSFDKLTKTKSSDKYALIVDIKDCSNILRFLNPLIHQISTSLNGNRYPVRFFLCGLKKEMDEPVYIPELEKYLALTEERNISFFMSVYNVSDIMETCTNHEDVLKYFGTVWCLSNPKTYIDYGLNERLFEMYSKEWLEERNREAPPEREFNTLSITETLTDNYSVVFISDIGAFNVKQIDSEYYQSNKELIAYRKRLDKQRRIETWQSDAADRNRVCLKDIGREPGYSMGSDKYRELLLSVSIYLTWSKGSGVEYVIYRASDGNTLTACKYEYNQGNETKVEKHIMSDEFEQIMDVLYGAYAYRWDKKYGRREKIDILVLKFKHGKKLVRTTLSDNKNKEWKVRRDVLALLTKIFELEETPQEGQT